MKKTREYELYFDTKANRIYHLWKDYCVGMVIVTVIAKSYRQAIYLTGNRIKYDEETGVGVVSTRMVM